MLPRSPNSDARPTCHGTIWTTSSPRLFPSLLFCVLTLSAAEHDLSIRDYTGRGFAPDLVQYAVAPGKGKVSRLRVHDGTGAALPVQLSKTPDGDGTTLSFVAEVPANGTAIYTLRDYGKGKSPEGQLRAQRSRSGIELSNALLAVRLPRELKKRYRKPVAARELPAPILAFKSGGSDWMGNGRFLTDRTASACQIRLVENGPVYAELHYEIDWADGGFYRARIRVIDRVPVVKLWEEFDIGKLDGTHFWELDLAQGWSPDRTETAMTNCNGGVDRGRVQPIEALSKKPMQYLVPDSAWGPLSQLGLFNEAEKEANGAGYAMAGLVPLHKGHWRRMNGVQVHSSGPTDVRLRFPVSVRHASWKKETASETSPFSTQEHEPGFSKTRGRRIWGLALSRPAIDCGVKGLGPFYQLRLLYGVVGLDRYKDFVLDWAGADVAYPRLYRKAEELDAYREVFQASSLPAEFKTKVTENSYALSNDDAVAEKRATHALSRLNWAVRHCFTSPTVSHHATSSNYAIAAAADDVLGWPGMPEEKRREIRARIALMCYLYEEPDVLSYANGAHHGNPNMGTAQSMSMSTFLALVPDHPMFEQWLPHMAAYAEYKAGTQIAPGGGYFEFGSAYHMHGGARTTNALPGLAAVGAPNLEKLYRYLRDDWDYYLNLLTPFDPRWRARMIPGMANSPPGNTEHIAEAAGALAPYDPEFAANLLWAWQANGANPRGNRLLFPGQVEPRKPELRSRIFPGVGVIFRAHQGPEETYMLFRSGFQWSHWYRDPGHFILYSRGAPLVPFQPYQYWWSPNKEFDMYNTMRFGHPKNQWIHGWGDCNVLDYAFGETVDYAWSSTGFPDWYIHPGASEEWREKNDAPVTQVEGRLLAEGFEQEQGAFEWNRQILFMKGKAAASPNYFVIRDTTTGDGRLASYLFLNLLGRQKDVKVRGGQVSVDTEYLTNLDLRFVSPEAVKPDFFEENQPIAFHNNNLPARLDENYTVSRNWVKKDGTSLTKVSGRLHRSGTHEQHVFLRIPGQPGAGYFWIAYPRGEEDPLPEVRRLTEDAIRVAHPEGTDFVFASSSHCIFEGEDVVFEGSAGAVRIRQDRVTLSLAGGAGRVGYRGHVIEGLAPIEKTIPLSQLKPQVETTPAPASAIEWPTLEAEAKQLAPGVSERRRPFRVEYAIDSPTPVTFRNERVTVEARKASIVLQQRAGIRFIAPEATYVKLTVGNVGVRGAGPFDLLFSGSRITGKVEGRMRSIVTTWPEGIVRPMYHMDGVRYYAGWADDHSISKGTRTPQFAIGFGVTDGPHTIEIAEWTYPPLPPVPERKSLRF